MKRLNGYAIVICLLQSPLGMASILLTSMSFLSASGNSESSSIGKLFSLQFENTNNQIFEEFLRHLPGIRTHFNCHSFMKLALFTQK